MEKYDIAGQAADENMIWRMRFARWMTKGTHTHRTCNGCTFSKATMLKRQRFDVTFIRTFLVFLRSS